MQLRKVPNSRKTTSSSYDLATADEGQFDKDHPRRAEVNQRLENQDKRIQNEVKEGKMSKGEAATNCIRKIATFARKNVRWQLKMAVT
jgi:hypothetical protein